jgi:hypothetical protein
MYLLGCGALSITTHASHLCVRALSPCRLLESLSAAEGYQPSKAPRLQGDLSVTERTRTTEAAAAEVQRLAANTLFTCSQYAPHAAAIAAADGATHMRGLLASCECQRTCEKVRETLAMLPDHEDAEGPRNASVPAG